MGINYLHNVIFNASQKVCQRVVADVFKTGHAEVPNALSCFGQLREAERAGRSSILVFLFCPEGQSGVATNSGGEDRLVTETVFEGLAGSPGGEGGALRLSFLRAILT